MKKEGRKEVDRIGRTDGRAFLSVHGGWVNDMLVLCLSRSLIALAASLLVLLWRFFSFHKSVGSSLCLVGELTA